MKKLIRILCILLPISLLLSACGGKNTPKTKNELMVYTTVYPLQYFTEVIGGNLVTVETVYPPGSDEHTFEPTQKDMMKLADSDLFIYVGLGLEGFVEKTKETLKNEHVTMIATGEGIHFEEEAIHKENGDDHHEDDGHNHGDINPHVWLDPIYAKELALAIKNALVAQLPDKEDEFVKNYDALVSKLDELNTKFEDTISQAKQKEIIVAHAAYGYWESRYGLQQISVSGLSSSSEPSQKELESIISTAKEHDIQYIFFEQNISSKLAEIVQKEIGAKPLTLHNLGVLTEADLENNQDYFSLMEQNIDALNMALN